MLDRNASFFDTSSMCGIAFSFPSSAWERTFAKLCFAASRGPDGKQSFPTCVPKQSLGTSGARCLSTGHYSFFFCIGLALLVELFLAGSASAYVGPGAGLELIGYTFTLLAWALTAFSAVLLWPLYAFIQRIRGRARTPAAPPTPASSGETCADDKILS